AMAAASRDPTSKAMVGSVWPGAALPCGYLTAMGEATMDLKLHGRTALVTGASMGIGRGIALALAAEGVKLAAVARRRPLLDELAEEIARAQGQRPALITADIMAPNA